MYLDYGTDCLRDLVFEYSLPVDLSFENEDSEESFSFSLIKNLFETY